MSISLSVADALLGVLIKDMNSRSIDSNGDIVACLVDGDSATVKRFHKEKKEVVLLPENEDYSPIHIPPEDFESGDARILGIAVEVKIKL